MEIGHEHPGVPDNVQDNGVAIIVGVEGMEDVTGLDIEPPDVASAPGARHDADMSRILRVSVVGQANVPTHSPPGYGDEGVGQPDPANERGKHQPGRRS